MSSGDTPPSRFTSPSSTSTSTKKYPGTPKSPMLNNNNNSNANNSNNNNNTNTGNRNSQARQRLLASKISAPRPINLPSLKREHAVGSDVPVSSPATSHGWGSTSSSPSISQQQQHTDTEKSTQQHEKKQDPEITDKMNKSSDITSTTSPVLIPASSSSNTATANATTTRAWAVPTIKQTKVPPSIDFPTAAEAASGTKKKISLIDDKEYLKYASSDPNHTSWDEMVSEDLDDFSVDVIEFDDGTKVQVESDASSAGSSALAATTAIAADPVLPSERFTDDYDRSYPPKQQHHDNDQHHSNSNYKPYRRSEDHGYNPRYNNNNSNNNNNNSSYNSRRHSTEGGNERRISSASGTSDRWTTTTSSSRRDSMEQTHYGNRRPSYDRKHDNSSYHPTSLLQRPRRLSDQSFRSDHSREDNSNPLQIIPEPTSTTITTTAAITVNESTEEITVAQKNLMLTAAERAKKRLEEQEAEFKAAAERAKQKADALAAKQAELKEKKILKKPAVDTTTEKNTPPSLASATSSKTNVSTTKTLASVKTSEPTTPAAKASLPPKIPDTSKPWNLVAANKQTLTTASTSPTSIPPVVKNELKESLSQTSNEQSSTVVQDFSDNKEKKPVTIMKKEPKPILSKKEEDEDDKSKKPLTEDEKKWQKFVSTIKTDEAVATKEDITPRDWNSYADRLQETTAEQDAIAASTRQKLIEEVEKEIQREQQNANTISTGSAVSEQAVEVMYYENEEWGTVPVNLMNGRGVDRGGWIRDENVYNQQRGGRSGRGSGRGGRGGNNNRDTVISTSHISRGNGNNTYKSNNRSRTTTSSSTDHWRQDNAEHDDKPVVVEILKKQEPEKDIATASISKKTRLTNLLKESSSPIFPDFIDKLAAKKPANMSFMVDTEESDKEITMMGQSDQVVMPKLVEPVAALVEEEEIVSVATTATTTTTNSNSTSSTPTKAQFPQQQQQQQRRMNVNRHFPVLVYQYPNQSSSLTTSDKLASSSPSTTTVSGTKSPSPPHHNHHQQQQQQQRPMGVYLMPQQPYLTNNQYVVPYPQAGTGNVQPIYFPTLSWQQQQQQQQQSHISSRPSYDHQQQQQHRRPFDNTYNDYTPPTSTNGYKHHRYPNNFGIYQNTTSNGRGNSYRKRGGSIGATQSWSGFMVGNGRGAGRGTGGNSRGGYQQQQHHHQNNYNPGHNNNRNYNNNDGSKTNLVVNESITTSSTTSAIPPAVDIAESSTIIM